MNTPSIADNRLVQVLNSHIVQQTMDGEIKPFAAITLMRKACNHPELVALKAEQLPPEELIQSPNFWQQSGKMVVLQQLLESWKSEGHRGLIFTQTRTVKLGCAFSLRLWAGAQSN